MKLGKSRLLISTGYESCVKMTECKKRTETEIIKLIVGQVKKIIRPEKQIDSNYFKTGLEQKVSMCVAASPLG